MFLLVAYLLSAALHEFLDVDVTAPGGRIVVAMSSVNDTDASGKGEAAEHHCHGCFSISVPAPVVVSATVEPRAVAIPQAVSQNSGRIPGIDTPPPKLLT